MVLMFDLRDRHLAIRNMTDEEFNHFQELNKKYVKAWNEAEVYLRKMVKKYLFDPITVKDSPNTISNGAIWICDICGASCKNLDEKQLHIKKTGHRIYTSIIDPMF